MSNKPTQPDVMENLSSLLKRRGFIFQGSEIYGGLAGTWDYGPLGVALKNNIKTLWWKRFVDDRDDMYGMDAAILMNQNVWKASGHVGGFADPLVECAKCKRRFRADQLEATLRDKKECPECGGKLGEERQFNMMFQTNVGATQDESSVSYLRPETAQGMFVNFKNVLDTMHPKLPFGMAQIGKAFRNEISPRDFIFRTREFEQMEIEYFVDPANWEETFNHFVKEVHAYTQDVGLPQDKVHEHEIAPGDLAHYSKRTIDFEFDYPFGKTELYGLAYRTDFDLKAHSTASGTDLSYYDEEKKVRFVPHCIEPSFGVDRTVLAVLTSAYTQDELGGEKREYLKLSPAVAPIKVAVFPLLKNKDALTAKAKELHQVLRKEFAKNGSTVEYDTTGSIGKRYRKQDEIGTPFCVTVDFATIEKDGSPVTVRDRDTGAQESVKLDDLVSYLAQKLGR
ncbi:MAG: glycine--tRNA ligase [bacterium]|nr:glycine--tRNA ligase [bacterium]